MSPRILLSSPCRRSPSPHSCRRRSELTRTPSDHGYRVDSRRVSSSVSIAVSLLCFASSPSVALDLRPPGAGSPGRSCRSSHQHDEVGNDTSASPIAMRVGHFEAEVVVLHVGFLRGDGPRPPRQSSASQSLSRMAQLTWQRRASVWYRLVLEVRKLTCAVEPVGL